MKSLSYLLGQSWWLGRLNTARVKEVANVLLFSFLPQSAQLAPQRVEGGGTGGGRSNP